MKYRNEYIKTVLKEKIRSEIYDHQEIMMTIRIMTLQEKDVTENIRE